MKKVKRKNSNFRKDKGFSLLYVLSVGSIASLLAFAIMAPLLPVYRHVARQEYNSRLGTTAETAMQYAIARLNSAAEASDGSLDSIVSPILVPFSVVHDQNIQVEMQILDSSNSSLTGSPIYNKLNKWEDINPSSSRPLENYRRLKVICSNGTSHKTIDVILGPENLSSNTSNQPYFSNSIFGRESINLTKAQINFASTNFSRDVNLLSTKGDLKFGQSGSSIQQVAGSVSARNITAPSKSDVEIQGDIHATNTPNTSEFDKDSTDPNANVLGDKNRDPVSADPDDPDLKYGSINQNVQDNIVSPAPSKLASQPASLTSPENGVLSVLPSANVQSLGYINLGGSNQTDTLIIPPGEYTAQGINLESNGAIKLPDGSTGNVVIYLDSPSLGNNSAINISGNGITNVAKPSQFQLYYNGSKQVSINTKSFNGLVYAPNAPINLTLSDGGTFSGALSGNNVSMEGKGTVNYDPNSTATTSGGSGPGYAKPNETSKPKKFRVLSWRETP